MELSPKIQEVDSFYSMKLSSLKVYLKYPITRAEKFGTRFWHTIVLAIRDSPDLILNVFVPRTICCAFSDVDIEDINSEKVALNLIFKGQCVNTHPFKMAIKRQQMQ